VAEEEHPQPDEEDVKGYRKQYLILSAGVLIVVLAFLFALIVKAPVWVAIIAALVGAAAAFALYRFAMAQGEKSDEGGETRAQS
jgi:uncharacterized MnhB-related membrane protein